MLGCLRDFIENYILQMLGCLDDFMILSAILDYELSLIYETIMMHRWPEGIDGYYLSH